MTLLSVTVTGPPASICSWNRGITLPLLPRTLPKRTVLHFVLKYLDTDCTYISATLFVAPITFVGFTALSVETMTKFSALHWHAASTTFFDPNTLLSIA